jgi:ribosomal protein L7Ae-like RNA K-turn-binding protein
MAEKEKAEGKGGKEREEKGEGGKGEEKEKRKEEREGRREREEKRSRVRDKKIVIGAREVLKLLEGKNGKRIKEIVIATDLKPELKEKLMDAIKQKTTKDKIKIETNKTRKQLAEELHKPFLIGCIAKTE